MEKELLAIVFSLKRFHYFVYPKKVVIYTDHRPLINIVNKPLDDIFLRLQLTFMTIQRYNAEIIFRPGRQMKFADALSSCPMESQQPTAGDVNVVRLLPMRDSTIEEEGLT